MSPYSLRFRSKRARLALRFFTYGVMTLATVVLTTLAIFYALGYRFNQGTLTFEQGGLVQFRSTPEGAAVVVDGRIRNTRTPGRLNLPAGVHTIVMQLDGYRDWQRTVLLAPGQLLWLNYVRFIPNSITTTPLETYSRLASVLPSPDRRWMLLQEAAQEPRLVLANFNNEQDPEFTNLRLPAAQLTRIDGKYGTFTVAEWSLNSRHFLVRHQNGQVREWLWVDRTAPAEAINVSRLFRLEIDDMQMAGSSPNIVFVRTGDVLRRLDIGANSASAALASGVQQFDVYGDDTISFVATQEMTLGQPESSRRVVGLYRGNDVTVVQTFPVDTQLRTAYSRYGGHDYLAIHTGKGDVSILRDPADDAADTAQFAAFSVGQPVQWLRFSDSGRMIIAGAGASVATYDLEVGTDYAFNLPYLEGEKPHSLRWLDDYYVWSDSGDTLRIIEFDGQNERTITSVSQGFRAMLSQSGKQLFSIGKNERGDSYVLQASKLVED